MASYVNLKCRYLFSPYLPSEPCHGNFNSHSSMITFGMLHQGCLGIVKSHLGLTSHSEISLTSPKYPFVLLPIMAWSIYILQVCLSVGMMALRILARIHHLGCCGLFKDPVAPSSMKRHPQSKFHILATTPVLYSKVLSSHLSRSTIKVRPTIA